jgi:hypothetical protein
MTWVLVEERNGKQICFHVGTWLSSIEDLKRACRRDKRRVVAVYRLRNPVPA